MAVRLALTEWLYQLYGAFLVLDALDDAAVYQMLADYFVHVVRRDSVPCAAQSVVRSVDDDARLRCVGKTCAGWYIPRC